jgi:hypothetical protein
MEITTGMANLAARQPERLDFQPPISWLQTCPTIRNRWRDGD